jgi:hypothetical protein
VVEATGRTLCEQQPHWARRSRLCGAVEDRDEFTPTISSHYVDVEVDLLHSCEDVELR